MKTTETWQRILTSGELRLDTPEEPRSQEPELGLTGTSGSTSTRTVRSIIPASSTRRAERHIRAPHQVRDCREYAPF